MNTTPDKNPDEDDKKFPGYPHYDSTEDIYRQDEELEDTDPETLKRKKVEQDFAQLDIPGAELDDANEAIGNEDEENNYYSIGGENHDNLEENTDKFDPERE